MIEWSAVEAWVEADPDETDRRTIRELLDRGDDAELERRFARPLRFGTAGLRGPVMAGPAGMNRLTVRRASFGVATWLARRGIDRSRGVVVARDARHGSADFADETVRVLLGAGLRVFEFEDPVPTPLAAFAARFFGASAAVVITASHNPAVDNGFKLYGPDGMQIVEPDDEEVEAAARATPLDVALADREAGRHLYVSDAVVRRYRRHFLRRFALEAPSPLRIVYTPLHGVGGEIATSMLREAGYGDLSVVDEQFEPDPDFPTLAFPNPEEPGALDLAMDAARVRRADLVLANDPDADRLGVAVRRGEEWRVLRGDEIGWLLGAAAIRDGVDEGEVVATSIVSSTLLGELAKEYGVTCVRTLTGFKWIERANGAGRLRFGYEEALGYAVDESVRDKDGISAALALAHLANAAQRTGRTLLDDLDDFDEHFGAHAVAQWTRRASLDEVASLEASVARLFDVPPRRLGGFEVTTVEDLRIGTEGRLGTDGVLVRAGEDLRVVVRPSGTEAKLKAYVEVVDRGAGTARERRGRAEACVADVVAELAGLLG